MQITFRPGPLGLCPRSWANSDDVYAGKYGFEDEGLAITRSSACLQVNSRAV